MNHVVGGILKLVAAMRSEQERIDRAARDQEERERRNREVLEEQRRRREIVETERARIEVLREQATRWQESERIRLFAAAARDRGSLEELGLVGPALEAWSNWALEQANRLDPLAVSPPSFVDDADAGEQAVP